MQQQYNTKIHTDKQPIQATIQANTQIHRWSQQWCIFVADTQMVTIHLRQTNSPSKHTRKQSYTQMVTCCFAIIIIDMFTCIVIIITNHAWPMADCSCCKLCRLFTATAFNQACDLLSHYVLSLQCVALPFVSWELPVPYVVVVALLPKDLSLS